MHERSNRTSGPYLSPLQVRIPGHDIVDFPRRPVCNGPEQVQEILFDLPELIPQPQPQIRRDLVVPAPPTDNPQRSVRRPHLPPLGQHDGKRQRTYVCNFPATSPPIISPNRRSLAVCMSSSTPGRISNVPDRHSSSTCWSPRSMAPNSDLVRIPVAMFARAKAMEPAMSCAYSARSKWMDSL